MSINCCLCWTPMTDSTHDECLRQHIMQRHLNMPHISSAYATRNSCNIAIDNPSINLWSTCVCDMLVAHSKLLNAGNDRHRLLIDHLRRVLNQFFDTIAMQANNDNHNRLPYVVAANDERYGGLLPIICQLVLLCHISELDTTLTRVNKDVVESNSSSQKGNNKCIFGNCDRMLTTNENITEHALIVHLPFDLIGCQFCNTFKCRLKRHLDEHHRVVHDDRKCRPRKFNIVLNDCEQKILRNLIETLVLKLKIRNKELHHFFPIEIDEIVEDLGGN